MATTSDNSEVVVKDCPGLKRHVRGIKKMLEDGQSCDQVLLQLSSCQSRLKQGDKNPAGRSL